MSHARKPQTLTPRVAAALLLALASGLALSRPAPGGLRPAATRAAAAPAPAAAREAYGQIEMSFEENRGQTDGRVKYLARGGGYTLFLTQTEAVFALARKGAAEADGRGPLTKGGAEARRAAEPPAVLRMRWEGAKALPAVSGVGELEGKVNHFVGSDPARWRTNMPTYGRVRYDDVYEGVGLVFYGKGGQLEYDFVVAPGADYERIALSFEGADRVELDAATGDLLLQVGGGTLRQSKPTVYQEADGARREVEGGYEPLGAGRVGFRVGEYDRSKPLVIDPVLLYSTYLGGSDHFDEGYGVAVDSSGNAYVVGYTGSVDFPTTAGAFQTTGSGDVFVTKINAAGTALVYSTYLGGDEHETGEAIAVDSSGNAYVTGGTLSTDFPTANAFQPAHANASTVIWNRPFDAFVTKLAPSGSALVYSTYLGGAASDGAGAIAVDGAGSAYVTGGTGSTNFPTTAGAFQPALPSQNGIGDAFVTKLTPSGSALAYSTFLGGADFSDGGSAIAVDGAGSAYVAGSTGSDDFPTTAGAFQPALAGATPSGAGDAFVTKLTPSGSALAYSTYLGGGYGDGAAGIALDAAGSAYVTGGTESADFPTTPNAFQPVYAGADRLGDAFVTKLAPSGSALAYSTYLGRGNFDRADAIAVDAAGNAYVAGSTWSPDFPTAHPLQPAHGGGFIDAFVTKINAAGTALVYSTLLGGDDVDRPWGIAVDGAGGAYVTGGTGSTNFPTTAGAFQPKFTSDPAAGSSAFDAFILKIGSDVVTGRVVSPSGDGIAGVTVTLSGTDSGVSASDANGNFAFLNTTPGGSYTVTPSLAGFAFSPQSVQISSLGGNQNLLFVGTGPSFQFGAASYTADEGAGSLRVTVTRVGDTSQPASVAYATTGGTADDRGDYTAAAGWLSFQPGDAAKSLDVFITDDAHVEGGETLQVTLSNPAGATLGEPRAAAVTIVDNDAATAAANPSDSTAFFVRQHYVDFLGREPDPEGFNFWTNEIEGCGTDLQCREVKRINVSAAFFLSIEFQETGYLVYRLYKAAYGDATSPNVPGTVPAVRMREFLIDRQQLSQGVRVNVGDWRAQLEANKQAYALDFVRRPRFLAAFPQAMTAEAFVSKLDQNAGLVLSADERAQLVSSLAPAPADELRRAAALREVAEHASLKAREFNRAFVLMQYFGYLRRDPDAAPDSDFRGWRFWLDKLEQFHGNFVRAEMVKAFLTSVEYRQRFGPP